MSTGGRAGRRPTSRRSSPPFRRAAAIVLLTASLVGTSAAPASAQITSPCEVTCALVLGATGFTFATGALVARGRHSGGVSTFAEVAGVWGGGFVAFVGAGIALNGDGERQRRAVYAAGIGALGGSLVGLGIESALGGSSGARKVAAVLMGAAAAAVVGGVYGAVSAASSSGAPARAVGFHIAL